MLGRIWPDVPPTRRTPTRPPDAHRPGVPLPVGRARWRPVPRPRPGRDAARLGHHVEVLTPAEREDSLTDEWITFAGRTVPVPYNGSMARMQFGPVSAARVRRWLRDGHFDVVHVHEPAPPRCRLLVCMIAKGPIVATFHAATMRSSGWPPGAGRAAAAGEDQRPDRGVGLGPPRAGRAPRRGRGDHPQRRARRCLRRRSVAARATPRRRRAHDGLPGRFDEPRKGLPVLLDAMRGVVRAAPGARLLVAGRGDADEMRGVTGPELRPDVVLLGEVTEADKAAACVGRRVLRAEPAGGASASCSPRRWRPGRPSWPATWTRSHGAGGGAAGVLVRRGDPAALPARSRPAGRPRSAGNSRPAARGPPPVRLAGGGPADPRRLRDGPARQAVVRSPRQRTTGEFPAVPPARLQEAVGPAA